MTNATWDYDGLRVTMTSTFDWRWSDSGSGGKRNGSYGNPAYGEITGKKSVILVGPSPNAPAGRSPAVARPTSYTNMWSDSGSGGANDGTMWRPVAPSGYVAMGDVMASGYGKQPSLNDVWCLRSDLTRLSTYEASDFWNDGSSGADRNCSTWKIVTETNGIDGSEYLPIPPYTFRVSANYGRPDTSYAVVPLLRVPNAFKRFDFALPTVTKTTIPSTGDQFGQQEQCSAVLPFIFYLPNDSAWNLARISKPFYTVSREIAWNTIKWGISKTQSEEMVHSAGVSVSASYGIKGFESSVTLNYQFTQTTSKSFTEYQEGETTESFVVPGKTVKVLFSKHIWLKAKAGDGTMASQVEMVANNDIHFGGCDLS
ncbi:uncharacterized protein EAE98_002754 [Botrytis deweyae]|uniref:Insecticidal crystal toxin domain-containing protein n=1 Tax=Botrytis deweyae TaxID=2478750 RepID=A0ABQ7IUN0_9HELO|nr:uncharacterized protein EAE98_002754 [Botrytis deweyae]KAF7934709.1 hypothetical protein EAE98_002754 [Botrytis deweyae]